MKNNLNAEESNVLNNNEYKGIPDICFSPIEIIKQIIEIARIIL